MVSHCVNGFVTMWGPVLGPFTPGLQALASELWPVREGAMVGTGENSDPKWLVAWGGAVRVCPPGP